MKISFNLIFDWFKDRSIIHNLPGTDISFSRPSLLPDDAAALTPDRLYVCSPDEAQEASLSHPGAYFICPVDKQPADDALAAIPYNIVLTVFESGVKGLFFFLEEHFFETGEWYARMQELILNGSSLQELITLSEPVIGNTIDVSDSAFTLLATTYGIETDHQFSLLLRQYGYHPESTLQIMRKHDRFSIYESAGTEPIIFKPHPDFGPYYHVNRIFRFQNIYFTHVVMICDHKPLTPGLLELFDILSSMLAVLMKREWDKRNNESNNSELFIKSVIEGALSEKNEIERRSTYFGLPANGSYELTAVSTENDIGVYKTRFIRELSELLPSSRVTLYNDLFLILSPVGSHAVRSSELNDAHLEQFLKRNMACGGSSGVFTSLTFLPLAYKRASLALKYSPANCRGHAFIAPPNEPPLPVICSFADCFSRCIAGESPDGELLWRNSRIGKALITLYRHDAEHNNNNLPLLYTYLLSGMSASHTASIFHMHRNNVPYRISRISSIIDMDVTDEAVRQDLFLSFVMFDIYGP